MEYSFKMYVIVDRYEEDFYYSFKTEELEHTLDEKCLLPSRELAEEYIEDHLSDYYTVAQVTIYQITKNGIWEYSIEDVWRDRYADDWDDDDDWDFIGEEN